MISICFAISTYIHLNSACTLSLRCHWCHTYQLHVSKNAFDLYIFKNSTHLRLHKVVSVSVKHNETFNNIVF